MDSELGRYATSGDVDHTQLRQQLANVIDAYEVGRRLNVLKDVTAYEFLSRQCTFKPARFKVNPIHLMPGLNT
ncbi:hypothetical protein VB151_16775 [Xanthomonas fragariae]|uniref:Integrase n=1 Tax=Xanthomonas fragariae TaxID=48664 RepID=A0A1Y6HD88_9XANT|nr:hypothetical protein [Xanthomonas fragariae]AOD15014.1 hypothetical protein BER92_10000 [Xanthomonas fragariae]AOD18413.1 hypothetical protein BER93_10020 [Xanthomonas fragariae]ENZ94039.1 integrase, catalytic region [Xanthomonas fragariae LMG 25863]MBL9198652.1 hypothetical protein [Xanthomonas fragariae]MBL9220942.1 hypothetical protein [Xanthomonas fragariae]